MCSQQHEHTRPRPRVTTLKRRRACESLGGLGRRRWQPTIHLHRGMPKRREGSSGPKLDLLIVRPSGKGKRVSSSSPGERGQATAAVLHCFCSRPQSKTLLLLSSPLPLRTPPHPMETSLRLRGGGGLRIHAKEKLPLGYNSLLQAHAELDTTAAQGGGPAPSYLALFLRHFYPRLSANVGVGVQLHNGDELAYTLRGKKAIPFTSNGLLGINLKGRLLANKEFKPRNRTGAVELAWTILDFRKGQDVRLKVGYEMYYKVPYFQLRENNWTLNAYMDGKWDVRFDM